MKMYMLDIKQSNGADKEPSTLQLWYNGGQENEMYEMVRAMVKQDCVVAIYPVKE